MRFLLSNTDAFAAGFSIINTKFKTLMHGIWGDNAIIRVTSWASRLFYQTLCYWAPACSGCLLVDKLCTLKVSLRSIKTILVTKILGVGGRLERQSRVTATAID